MTPFSEKFQNSVPKEFITASIHVLYSNFTEIVRQIKHVGLSVQQRTQKHNTSLPKVIWEQGRVAAVSHTGRAVASTRSRNAVD